MWKSIFGGERDPVTPPPRQHTGKHGDLSPEMSECLHIVREWVRNENLDPLCQFDDYDLLRFCRARKFVV